MKRLAHSSGSRDQFEQIAAFREYSLYYARIFGSSKYPHLVGRDVLIPVGDSVRVIFSPADAEGTDQRC